MKNFRYYLSICLFTIFCVIAGGLIYSQSSVAKNDDKNIAEVAAPTELLSYESGNFKYKQLDMSETPPANFEIPNFDDSTWDNGTAAFGGGGGCLSETVRTNWSVNSRLLVRKVVNVPTNSTNLKIYTAVDSDIEGVYVNGTRISGVYRGECGERDSAVYQVPDNLLQLGENLIAYHLYDYGGASYFDTRVTADINPVCTLPPPNGVSWYRGEGNANDSFGTNNGILENGAIFAPGKVGQAFSLDNQDDYVDLGQLSQLQNATELTVMAWVKKKQLGRREGFVGKWNTGEQNNNTFLLYNGEPGRAPDSGGVRTSYNKWQ